MIKIIIKSKVNKMIKAINITCKYFSAYTAEYIAFITEEATKEAYKTKVK